MAVVLVLALSGCMNPAGDNPADPAGETAWPSWSDDHDFPLAHGQDVVLSLDVMGNENVTIDVMFENITPLPGRDAWTWGFHALTHGKGSLSMTRTWYSLGSVAVSVGGGTIDAGPAWGPLMNEILVGQDFSNDGWTISLAPDHYHVVLGVDGATAQAYLEVADDGASRIRASVEATQTDAANMLSSFNPDDFDQLTQVYTPVASAADLHHEFTISHPLNNVVFVAGGPYQWKLTGPGVDCGFHYYIRYQIAGMANLPIGTYTLDATGAGDVPWVFLKTVEIPGHESVGQPLDSAYCD